MAQSIESYILAVITSDRQAVGGGAPIFYGESHQEVQKLAFTLEKIMDGVAHELRPDTLIIVKHS